jgi:pSer/pThr/pTyr-binding forkhead associated (FHA) protein
MWILRSSGEAEATFRLMPGAVKTLGRATRADFILDAALVSRLHCRLSVKSSGDLEIEDLKSTNGTYVNDKRVRKALLAQGDLVRIGRVQLTVHRQK